MKERRTLKQRKRALDRVSQRKAGDDRAERPAERYEDMREPLLPKIAHVIGYA